MASTPEHISMALFCDFENVALGVRDANYEKFDIKRVLERLLLKGSIVVKKAYCDWERYKGFKAAMHEANFELIEIPHVRQSGKNSADIRLVVDALDLCYTKSHVNTFVIISGDSDFSPLVSKLRENAKYVIGVGVKQSTSDLLTANCDEFIFYDDLVRESARVDARRNTRNNQPAAKRSPEEEQRRRAELDVRRSKAVEMALETYEALVTDRDEGGKIWASVLKEAIKRRKPDFSEGRYGFRTFGNLLEEAQARGLLEFGRDEKSGAYVYRGLGPAGSATATARPDGAGDRASQGGATRHDFHAVATAPDSRADSAANQDAAGRGRGRRSAESDRPEARAALRNEPPESGQAEASDERPASRYFSQPAPPGASATPLEPASEALALEDAPRPAQDAMDNPAQPAAPAEAEAPAAAAPRRGRARSAEAAEAETRPRAASRKAATGRTRGAAAAPDAGDGSAAPSSAASVPESATVDTESAGPVPAPIARPRSRARKPAAKPAK